MKINLEFDSINEMFSYCNSVLAGFDGHADETDLPFGAHSWEQAYEGTFANLNRAYERIREFEALKKTNPVIRAEFEKINSKLFLDSYKDKNESKKDLLTNLTFSSRVINALDLEGITTISQLLECDEHDLMSMQNFGKQSLKDVNDVLKANKLKLRGKK